jgi:antitoxin YefM
MFVPYWYISKIMVIVSSREFRDHLKKYFELVDQNEQIIVQRGKDKAYVIVPLNDADRLSVNEELIQTVREAEEEYSKRVTTSIKDPGDIWESIL